MTTFARTDLGYVGFTVGALRALSRHHAARDVLRRHDPAPHHPHADPFRLGRARPSARVYAWNTLGSIVGVVVGGLVLLPMIGVKAMLVAGAVVDMAIGALLVSRASDRRLGSGWLAVPPRRLAAGLGLATAAICAVVITQVAAGAAAAVERRLPPRHDPEPGCVGDDVLPRRPDRDGLVASGRLDAAAHARHQRQARRVARAGSGSAPAIRSPAARPSPATPRPRP